MASTTYEDALRIVRQLTPEEQARLIEELEDAADVAAYDAAKAVGADPLPLSEALAEIERERQALRKAG